MADNEAMIDPENQPRGDEELAPEVPTAFATKGVGWSGRDGIETDDDDE